jgi:hypothetical protein
VRRIRSWRRERRYRKWERRYIEDPWRRQIMPVQPPPANSALKLAHKLLLPGAERC